MNALRKLIDEEMWNFPGYGIFLCVKRFGVKRARAEFLAYWNDLGNFPGTLTNAMRATLIGLAPPPGVTVTRFKQTYGYQDPRVNAHNDHWTQGTLIAFTKDEKRTDFEPVPDNWDEYAQDELHRAGCPDFDTLLQLGKREADYRKTLPKRDGFYWVQRSDEKEPEVARIQNGHVAFCGSDYVYDSVLADDLRRVRFIRRIAPPKNRSVLR